MCTVSYYSKNNSRIITSNRDENIIRPKALLPTIEKVNSKLIVYPKDAKAGGTWFATDNEGTALVLLNGAFNNHITKPIYAKSRGILLIEAISSNNAIEYIKSYNLQDIAPFTLIISTPTKLMQFIWDENKLHKTMLNPEQHYIWSSVTLYDTNCIDERKQLFAKFTKNIPVTQNSLMEFHFSKNNNQSEGFIIDRKNGMKTFSVTQATVTNNNTTITHKDIATAETTIHQLPLLVPQFN